jgi:hypothetical protein
MNTSIVSIADDVPKLVATGPISPASSAVSVHLPRLGEVVPASEEFDMAGRRVVSKTRSDLDHYNGIIGVTRHTA